MTHNKFIALSFLAASILVSSCKKKNDNVSVDPPVMSSGKLTVKMSNEVSGVPVSMGNMAYTNAAGNTYRIDLLKYYVTNFTLVKDDHTERNFGNYKLIDASDTSTCYFTFDSVADGNYTSVRFYLGVDSAHNHTGDQTGDLDPIKGMIWMWQTGYIFFKHEGGFKNDSGGVTSLLYHYGTDPAITTIDIPVTQFTIKGDNKTLYLKFDLNKLYSSVETVNFTNNAVHESTDWNDGRWLQMLQENFPKSFSFDKVE